MSGSVDFSQFTDSDGNNEMYEKLKEKYEVGEAGSQYVIFDNLNKTVWLCWCEGKLL